MVEKQALLKLTSNVKKYNHELVSLFLGPWHVK